ncbi:MAG: hypothetical protein IE927_15400 [Rhodobacterales bacterium]|nr:hypothetical protein [Rhodobacterales bacterium]
MQRFLNEWKRDFRTPVPLAVWVFLSVVLPIAGPFGAYGTHSLPVLFAFWTVLVGGCILAATAIRAFVHAVLRLRDPWHEMLAVSVLVTLVLTPAIHLAVRNVFGREGSLIVDLARLAATCLAVSLGVGVLRVTLPMVGGRCAGRT